LSRILAVSLALGFAHALNAAVSIPPELTYLLPSHYNGELQDTFVNTNTTNKTENSLPAAAQNAPFISYDPKFVTIIGPNATLELIAEKNTAFASKAGVWVSDRKEV
jgi:gluconolactonase